MNIPLFKIYWDENDVKAVENAIRSGMYWCVGPQIAEFENMLREYLNAEYCLTFNSGGSALYALMFAYGFKPDDEIIVPSFTFIATAFAPYFVGARPVFADVETETFGLDPDDVEKKITPKTKAIIPIHYGGMPCKIEELKEIAEKHDLILIEDAAESFGAKFKGKNVGTFGNASIFSFCHNKVFTTSEGGCVVTDDEDIYNKLKLIRSYGRIVKGDYFTNPENLDYIQFGFNLRMSSLLASLGMSQLNKVDEVIKLRREHAQYLNEKLAEIDDIIVPKEPSSDYYAVYQMYTIRVTAGRDKRNSLMHYLKEKGIASRIYFDPVHEYSFFKQNGYNNVNLPNTKRLSEEVVTLPLYPKMSADELEYIVKTIHEFFKESE